MPAHNVPSITFAPITHVENDITDHNRLSSHHTDDTNATDSHTGETDTATLRSRNECATLAHPQLYATECDDTH